MKNKSILMVMLILFAFSFACAQDAQQKREMPPKHRGMHPRLQADGTVVDDDGKTLGSIKDGKVCEGKLTRLHLLVPIIAHVFR